jgi:hypothetical protein
MHTSHASGALWRSHSVGYTQHHPFVRAGVQGGFTGHEFFCYMSVLSLQLLPQLSLSLSSPTALWGSTGALPLK